MFKYLRIAVTVLGLTACVVLIVLWVRSYFLCDLLHAERSTSHDTVIGSARGSLVLVGMPDLLSPLLTRRWEWQSYPPIDEQIPEPSYLGFHYDPSWRGAQAIYTPHWFYVLVSGVFAGLPWITSTRRFSLRTLLVATTLIAVVLGIVAASM